MKKLAKIILVILAIIVTACSTTATNTAQKPESPATKKPTAVAAAAKANKANTAVPVVNTASAAAKNIAKIQGKAVRVADGDTITVLMNNQQYKIRLNGIDAPEKSQPFGNKSREYLRNMVIQKNVTVKVDSKDRYGRYLGWISTAGIPDVNGEMLKAGYAWHYKHYNKSAQYAQWETEARTAKRGLWADAHPQAPWDYRRIQRQKKQQK